MPQAEMSVLWHAGPAFCITAKLRANREIGVPEHGHSCRKRWKKEKRQTSRRIEDVPHSYLLSIVARELWGVKRFLRPMMGQFPSWRLYGRNLVILRVWTRHKAPYYATGVGERTGD